MRFSYCHRLLALVMIVARTFSALSAAGARAAEITFGDAISDGEGQPVAGRESLVEVH